MKTWNFGAALLLLACSAFDANAAVIAVEAQPLTANIQRVQQALDYLGAPLPSALQTSLDAAARARDAARLQELLDPLVLLVVSLNPEARVKVARGPSKAVLQQSGYTPVLVKVVNEGGGTQRLRIDSPQAGAVYAGVAKLSMERQKQEHLRQNENTSGRTDRFLDVDLFSSPPMTPDLSGLGVEYVIALLYSSEAGRREATITFDAGQGTQDLGFRAEVPVLFEVKPAIAVNLRVRDFDETPTTGRFLFLDHLGHVFPPQAKRLAPDLFFQKHIYRADGETVLLPPGEFTMFSGRGPEYRWQKRTVNIGNRVEDLAPRPPSPSGRGSHSTGAKETSGAQQSEALTKILPLPKVEGRGEEKATAPTAQTQPTSEISIRLERWVNPRDYGFFSGDHHIHAAGCAHYTSPSEGLEPAHMLRQVKGEALNVGCVLTWGPGFDHQHQFFAPTVDKLSEPMTQLKYDIEVSGFGSQALGHVCLLNLREQIYPGAKGSQGWPSWTVPVLRWVKQQGGFTGYAHSGSGLQIDPAAAAKRLLAQLDANHDGRLDPAEAAQGLLPESFELTDLKRDGNLLERGDGLLTEAELIASHDRVADQLPNLAIPELNSVGAQEIFVSTALGVCDFISAMDTERLREWNCWYHLMNCGFPLKLSGETDFPCMSSTRVGQGRVYVQLGQTARVDFVKWCEGLARGQSYVSDGYAHALEFSVHGKFPGGEVRLDSPGPVRASAKVAFSPETPLETPYGGAIPVGGRRFSGDTRILHDTVATNALFQRGARLVELVVNGRVVDSREVPADGKPHGLEFSTPIERSSWVALRQFPQLHTNPVNVLVGGRPIRAARASALWAIGCIDQLWRVRSAKLPPAERAEAEKSYEQARQIYRRIAEESPAGS